MSSGPRLFPFILPELHIGIDRKGAEINGIVRKVIRLNKKGIRIVLTDINHILNGLDEER